LNEKYLHGEYKFGFELEAISPVESSYRKIVKVIPCWDHYIPYAYSQNNYPYNFVAACALCNGIKSSHLFDTLEEAIEYVKRRRAKKGVTKDDIIDLSDMQESICEETKLA